MMIDRNPRRSGFGKRIKEHQEAQDAEFREFEELAVSFFGPFVIVVGVAGVVSAETWLRPYLRGSAHIVAGLIAVACSLAGIWWYRWRQSN